MINSLMTLALGAPPGGGQGGNPMNFMVTMMLIVGIFYFMMIRPQQRKEKERRKMIDEVKSGDRVMVCGGIIGTVTNVKENILVVRIADRVKMEVIRGAVNRVLDKDEKIGDEESSEQKS